MFRLAVFTRTFCQELVEELEHFERSPAPKGRPNTMNNYGVRRLPLRVTLSHLVFERVAFIRRRFQVRLRTIKAVLFVCIGGETI